jgi:RES domain-containing protein
MPPTLVSQSIGDRWLESARSAVLRVPSAVLPAESNFLMNPRHADFDRIEIAPPEVLGVDPRLI